MNMPILSEITPLTEKDCFYLVDRNKQVFDYPLHVHGEWELNFVSHCRGANRIVGDSIVELGDYDLALIGPRIAHCWEQHNCGKEDKREITIQFSETLLSDVLLDKSAFSSIKSLLSRARGGVSFGMNTIMEVYGLLNHITQEQPGFMRLLLFLKMLFVLSQAEDTSVLCTGGFSGRVSSWNSRRINKVVGEIDRNFKTELSLKSLADLVGMSPTAFSRFFRQHTNRTLSEYILEVRLGNASRLLVDTSMTVSEICYECGFGNVSNFNRLFKRCKGCSPTEFRTHYTKTRLMI
ncbi:MAG: helix-turn-helix transcriptional regulator [Bacteroidaceae bacterium]|nr:helix-turn-helix transcriptional regulator [Bacteroidaceae bacterium]